MADSTEVVLPVAVDSEVLLVEDVVVSAELVALDEQVPMAVEVVL